MTKVYTSKGTSKKLETVTALTDKVAKAKSITLVEYQGIKHKQLEELRRSLKKSNAEFVIAKNRLLKRALRASESAQGNPPASSIQSIEPLLEQPNASLFAYGDEVAPLKELVKFFKAVGFGKIKGGILGAQVLTDQEVKRLATLPAREVLLGNLARQLNAPIQGLHYALSWNLNKFAWALNAVKEKKGKN
jgi:large subunit ribosomal protein L10